MMIEIAPQWIVENVPETIKFYEEKLGFTTDWVGDPPLFAMLSKGNVKFMFRQLQQPGFERPNRKPFIEAGWDPSGKQAWDAYIWVEDAKVFYAECQEKNLRIIRELEATDYGNLDFDVEDIYLEYHLLQIET